jgi:NAD(P)-dependent dehydrogenase (short-subunit alcohol dehydrogenase family)
MRTADLADSAGLAALGLRVWDELGGIGVLVNDAALLKRRAVTALDPDEVEAVMLIIFFAAMRLTLAVLPRMLKRGTETRQRVQCRWPARNRARVRLLCK